MSLLLLLSCSPGGGSFTLSGKFKGLEQGEFVCYSSSPEWGTFDTVRVQGGKFTITHPLADTVVLTLQYPNFMQTQIIAIPGEEVTVRGDANNMLAIEVGSDDENETLSLFRQDIADTPPARRPAIAEQFVHDHPESWAAIAVFQKYILEAEHPDYGKISKLLDEMEQKRPGRKPLADMRRHMGALLTCRVGSKLPPFKAVTLRGDTITNATFKGKPLLITFWSTMVPEHSKPISPPPQGEGVSPLRGDGRGAGAGYSFLNICLDPDTAECCRILRRSAVGGYNVCDRLTFDSPLVRAFGLPRLPSNILVDSLGVIQRRDIPWEELDP